METQHDLPQTQALHFLRTLVADATLRVPMSPYLGQTALFCFGNLNSSVWSIRWGLIYSIDLKRSHSYVLLKLGLLKYIFFKRNFCLFFFVRNASLQLFGALVPKIVGQGKSTGDAEENDATLVGCIGFGDLMIRFSPLCNLLLIILGNMPASQNVLRNHAELIPSLSLLARLSVSELAYWSTGEVKKFKKAFLRLLTSPISTVRSLAAKAYCRYFVNFFWEKNLFALCDDCIKQRFTDSLHSWNQQVLLKS